MPNEEKLVSHYRLKTLLRRDGFGAVYLAEDTRDQKELVLRVIELDQKTLAAITGRVRARSQRDHPLIEQIRQRMKRISELKHSHILPVIEFGEEHIQGNNDIIFYMASPFEKESLLSYWSEHTSSAEVISLEVVADLLEQASEALLYVHKRGLVHQYVRLSSFMIRSSARSRKHLHLLLTDFWFADISAAILEDGQMSQALSVYLAPEQLSAGALAAASDQYALAILAYELLLGYRLSGVNLSLKHYETLLRQRSSEISESELAIARNLDLVLARALSENPAARFTNIDEFAYSFRAASRGEASEEITEATIKLPATGQRGHTTEAAEIVAGTLIVGEVVEELIANEETVTLTADDSTAGMLAAAQIDEEIHPEHGHSLHKTVLTSEGMEAEEVTLVAETDEETDETILVVEQSSTAAAEAAGFAAGLAVGEATILAQEQQIASASAAQTGDISTEQTLILESAAAALATSDISTEDTLIGESSSTTLATSDISTEDTLVMESGATALAAGLAAGALLANETEASAITQPGKPQVSNVESEKTQIAAGAAGSAAGALLASEAETGALTRHSAHQTNDIALEKTQVAAGGAGLVATGLAGATLASGATQRAGGISGTTGSAVRRSRRRTWLIVAALVLVLLLVGGTGTCALVNAGNTGAFTLFNFGNQSSATVTLTLQSHTISHSYLVTAVTTTTTGHGEVQAHLLNSTITQSKSSQASGFFSGTHATGFITFHNTSTGCGCPVIIPAGTAFTGASGVTVVTDTAASVASLCTVTVRAHAVIFGPGGDISVGDVHASFNSTVSATNPFAFGGGQAGQSNSLVQQSDIDGLSKALQSQVEQSAQAGISSQLQSSEHLLGAPSCQTRTTSDHPAGAVASNVNVTVSTTCTAEAYDYAGAVQIVQQQTQAETTTFSSKFALVGPLQTQVKSATLIDAKAGTILLEISVQGKWAYQFSNNDKQSLLTAITNQKVTVAREILAHEAGIDSANIAISGGDQSTLPKDASKITIVIKS